jgi:hypothetical protein
LIIFPIWTYDPHYISVPVPSENLPSNVQDGSTPSQPVVSGEISIARVSRADMQRIEKQVGERILPVMTLQERFYTWDCVAMLLVLLGVFYKFIKWYFTWMKDVIIG